MKTVPLFTDAELIVQYLAGNSRAFAELVNRHRRELKTYLHKLLHNATLEKDAMQNTWMDVLTAFARHTYNEKGTFINWVKDQPMKSNGG